MASRVKLAFFVGVVLGLAGVAVVAALTGTAPVSDGVPLSSPDGTTIVVDGDTGIDLEDPFPDANTVDLATDDGNLTATSSGNVSATVHKDDITGGTLTLSNVNVSVADLEVDAEGRRPLTVGGGLTSIAWADDATLDDGATDFEYTADETATVEFGGLPADTRIQAVNAAEDTLLDVADSDSSGTIRFTDLDSGDYDVKLQERDADADAAPQLDSDSMSPTSQTRYENNTFSIDVDDDNFPLEEIELEWIVDGTVRNTTTVTSAGTATAEIGPLDDGTPDWEVRATDTDGNEVTSETRNFEINHHLPDVNDISPEGEQSSEPAEISAEVSDEDFDKDGDELDVTIELDGTEVHTETLSANANVTASMPDDGLTGGEHTIEYIVEDSYNQTVTETVTYRVPDTLYIRNETDYDELIPANGEVRFFGDDQVYERTTDDGTLNMTGLPVYETFIVEVEPTSDDYLERTAFIDTIFEQQNVFTLNETQYNTIEARFVLNDPTGEYGPEDLLKIKRPINTTAGIEYQTIVADRFGAEGVTATLQNDTRYRLAVSDGTDEQSVGPYRSTISETVEVQPGQPTIDLSIPDEGWDAIANLDSGELEYRYYDPEGETDQLIVYIHERGNPDNLLVGNETYISVGDVSKKIALSENETEQEWVVEFVIDRNGDDTRKVIRVSDRQDLTPGLDAGWTAIVGVGLLVLLAGAFSMLNAAIGAVVVSLVGGLLWYIGFLGGATSGAAVAIALLISVIGYSYTPNR